MQLYCRQCGKIIQAQNVNLDNMIAKCSSCNAVFSFADMYEDIYEKPKNGYEDEPLEKPKRKYHQKVPLPKNMTIEQGEEILRIRYRWYNSATKLLLLFTVIWNSFIWGVFVPLVSSRFFPPTPFLCISIFFICTAIFLIYFSLASILNSTVIEVMGKTIYVTHKPLPFSSLSLTRDIVQFCVFERKSSKRNSIPSYELHALDKRGQKHMLLQGLGSPEIALYVEQELERYYGIENRHVSGEYQ